jgi:hypothetical protein
MNKTITKIPNGMYQCFVRAVRAIYEPTVRIELSFDIGEGEYKDYYADNQIPFFDNELSLTVSFYPLSYVDEHLFIRIIRMFEAGNYEFRFLSYESLLNKNICLVISDGTVKKLLSVNNVDKNLEGEQ